MFYTVQTQLHTTNQKLEGNVWEICVKSLLFSNWTCSVFQHIWICEMFGAVHLLLHAIKQKNFRIGKKIYIIITLCLTSQAIDSPVLTKLFTWGRHRNMLQKQHVSDIGPLPQFKWLKANGYSQGLSKFYDCL